MKAVTPYHLKLIEHLSLCRIEDRLLSLFDANIPDGSLVVILDIHDYILARDLYYFLSGSYELCSYYKENHRNNHISLVYMNWHTWDSRVRFIRENSL